MPTPAPPPSRWRVLWFLPVGLLFTGAFAIVASTLSIVTLGRFSTRLSPWLLRFWGRTILRIQGVTLDLQGAEHLTGRAMRVATFNHTSTMDAMIIPALTPQGGVSCLKREALYIPLVGLAVWSMGFLLIDRGRSERARRLLQKAARRMARDKLTVFIAPEGTRSPDGSLQPFKRGAFHLALESGAPVVPIVIDGAFELMPRQRHVARPGRLVVRVLPPIPTRDLTRETLDDFAAHLREVYQEALADLRATGPRPGA
ncbi:MAG: 1-acyl-sn-glycerol-3-phosphate acyltransferase [Myxococcales bacterium]|nr:1-acyl-sn-glycerol-3-phosphate acyltransferase [Myxococcales bacterium]